MLHALWHACTLQPYGTLDPSLVSHTFDLLVSIVLYYALPCREPGWPRDADALV